LDALASERAKYDVKAEAKTGADYNLEAEREEVADASTTVLEEGPAAEREEGPVAKGLTVQHYDLAGDEGDGCSVTEATRELEHDVVTAADTERKTEVPTRDTQNRDVQAPLQETSPSHERQMRADGYDAWAMPPMYSATLAGLQGRWTDQYNRNAMYYFVQGGTVHLVHVISKGRCAKAPLYTLTQGQGTVHLNGRWYVQEDDILKAKQGGELIWRPCSKIGRPLRWWRLE
jgi:hypothetical protein